MKKNILIFVDWYEPGYKAGGPIRSIAGFVDNLSKEFDISILTRDRDFKAKNSYDEVPVNRWVEIKEDVKVMYLNSRCFLNFFYKLLKLARFDLVYINSFFSPKYSLLPIVLLKLGIIKANRILIAPRGELNPERLCVKSTKKNAYIFIAKKINFYKNVFWHATSLEENKNINNIFPNKKTLLLPNLRKKNLFKAKNIAKKSSELRIAFVSRILEYKNLHYAIELLTKIDKSGIILDIYGPIEDHFYFEKCVKASALLNETKVSYKGELEHYQVIDTLSEYHLFLFPTKGENYGHVIAEALLAGCPVLVSDQTPWLDLEQCNAGWAISLEDENKFIKVINDMYAANKVQFDSKREAVVNYAQAKINAQEVIQKYIDFFSTGEIA